MESRYERGDLERDPRPAPGSRVPLFDRLTAPADLVKEKSGSSRSMSAQQAIESVRIDLNRLLNSRTTLHGPELTAINFGLPDFSHVSAMDARARNELALRIQRIIEAFEPRLSQIKVVVDPHRSGERYLAGSVAGVLRMGMLPEPVAFQLYLPDAHE